MHPTYQADKLEGKQTVECVVCGFQKQAQNFGWGNKDWDSWNFLDHGHFVRTGNNHVAFYCGRNNRYQITASNPWHKRPCRPKPPVLLRNLPPVAQGHAAESAGEVVTSSGASASAAAAAPDV